MYVSLPFTLDFILEAAKDSYKEFSSFKLIPYTDKIIQSILSEAKALPDLQRANWRFKNESAARKGGFGKKYVEAMQNNAKTAGIDLSEDEAKALLTLGISAGGVHWQNGTFGMSSIFLHILFQAQGFTISPTQALYLRDKIIESPQKNTYKIQYEIRADMIADSKEQFVNTNTTNLIQQVATFNVARQDDIYNIDLNDTNNTLEVDKVFFETKLLPRAKENFQARLAENLPLNTKDFFDYMPYLVDDDFALTFLPKISKMLMPDFLAALHYLELCFKHDTQRRKMIFATLSQLLNKQSDMGMFHFEMARSELTHVLNSKIGDATQKRLASIVMNQINQLPIMDLHENLKLYTNILHDTAALIRNPSDEEAFTEYEAIIQTVTRNTSTRLLRAAMIALLGLAVITLCGAIISTALAMPTIAITTGIILSAAFVIKSSIIVGGLGGGGALTFGLYSFTTNAKPIDKIIKSGAGFWKCTNKLIDKDILPAETRPRPALKM